MRILCDNFQVDAVNDGTFEGDTLLTVPQAAAMLQTARARRRKRYSLYFEAPENTIKKWDITSPILYIFDTKFREHYFHPLERTEIQLNVYYDLANHRLKYVGLRSVNDSPYEFFS
jgi:hypothetical protein